MEIMPANPPIAKFFATLGFLSAIRLIIISHVNGEKFLGDVIIKIFLLSF